MRARRTLLVWCCDWPVAASGRALDEPVAVVGSGQVVACSPTARKGGVQVGMRRRQAQSRCRELVVLAADPGRDARAFEPVAAAVEELTPGVEVVRPGVLALATRGPSRYFGGDQALAQRVAEVVGAAGGGLGCGVGVADGRFAAGLAARSALGEQDLAVRIVPPGGSREFVAPFHVSSLGLEDMAGLLVRLGVHTLGDLAALPAPAVLARLGAAGAAARRLALGLDESPVSTRSAPPELTVSVELDPPAERVDTAAFAARSLASEMHSRLAALGLGCNLVKVEAETEHGEWLVRSWRHEGFLDSVALAERVRWQLEGWLNSGCSTSGIALLRLSPQEVHPDTGRQLDLWGDPTALEGRAERSLARVQGIVGPDAVFVAQVGGGRDPASQVRLVPWEQARSVEAGVSRRGRLPWPGAIAGLAPAQVHDPPLVGEVRDHLGRPVEVSGRGVASAAPASFSVGGRLWQEVVSWAGPWPMEERWWDIDRRRRALFQICVSSGEAYLISKESGRWWVEATY